MIYLNLDKKIILQRFKYIGPFSNFRKNMSYDREREMFDAKCGDCGNDCKVPFQPKEDRPVYCRECFQNHK